MRAGVRLAQFLDMIAGEYFLRENLASQTMVVAGPRNRFQPLDVEFDADDFVYDPEASTETGGDSELEAVEFEPVEGQNTNTTETPTTTTVCPTTSGGQKGKKRRRAAVVSPRLVEGVDIENIVLTKVQGVFVISSKQRAESGLEGFSLSQAEYVGFQFARSSHVTFFALDNHVFKWNASLDLLEAVFLHLKGDGKDSFTPKLGGGTVVNRDSTFDQAMMPALTDMLDEGTVIELAPFSSIASFVRPKDVGLAVSSKRKGTVPTHDQRVRDILFSHKNDLLVLMHGRIVLVSTVSSVLDKTNMRWVLNVMKVGKWRLVVDARMLDELIPESVATEIVRLVLKPHMKLNRRIVETSDAMLHTILPDLEDYVAQGERVTTLLSLSVPFERVNRIDREGFFSLDLVLRDRESLINAVGKSIRGMIGDIDLTNPLFAAVVAQDPSILKEIALLKEMEEMKRFFPVNPTPIAPTPGPEGTTPQPGEFTGW